jgi:hypothetical protein
MRKTSALAVALAVGSSLWSCSDEKEEPGVGPDVSWQILCAPDDPTDSCSVSEKPHGPLDGRDPVDKEDDYKFKVSCSRPQSGLALTIEDPGRKQDLDKDLDPRPASVLEITRANPATNECIVAVTEYPIVNPGPRLLEDACKGNGSNPGTCVFKGTFDSNGYSFEGTLECAGLRYRNQGPAAWTLHAATPNNAGPVTIQVTHCD